MMVDLGGKDRGNISLPPRLQSPDISDPNYENDENLVTIINMQKALYDIRISDTEKRIRRLENRNIELLETQEDTEASIRNADVETGDQIAHLKKQIFTEMEKITDITQRIDVIDKMRDEAREIHEKNLVAVNEKYEKTRVALISSIKVLNAKINTLEDYKQTRVTLREKLILGDETMRRNEEEVMQRRDEIDRKFKIDREQLKNEMYTRLLALAGTFQIENSKNITKSVQRLMRENIFMKNELMQIANESLTKNEACTRMRSMRIVHRNSMQVDKRDTTNNLITMKIHRHLIDSLKQKHSAMKKILEKFNAPHEFAQEKYDKLAESVKNESMNFEKRMRKLEVVLHRENIKLERVKYRKNQSEWRRNKYEEIIYDVKYAVACALKITDTGEDILNMNKIELIFYLLNIIDRGQSLIRCHVTDSAETIPRPDFVYAKGDLGFEPEHVDVEDVRKPMKFVKPLSLEDISIDIPAVTSVVLTTASLQHDNNEFEETAKQTSISAKSSKSSDASLIDESKEESVDEHEDITEEVDTLEDDETIIEKEELSAESEKNEDI